MITRFLHWELGMGTIPAFDNTSDANPCYQFYPGELNQEGRYEGHYWQERISPRILVSLEVDAKVNNIINDLEAWIHRVHEGLPDVSGTLALAVRSRFDIEGDVYICMGLAFIPCGELGQPVGEDDIVQALSDAIITGCSAHDNPYAYTLMADDLWSMRERSHEWSTERAWDQYMKEASPAVQKARLLLYSYLSQEQLSSLEEEGYFDVVGSDGGSRSETT